MLCVSGELVIARFQASRADLADAVVMVLDLALLHVLEIDMALSSKLLYVSLQHDLRHRRSSGWRGFQNVSRSR